ncbi:MULTISPECIES: nucleoside kinase [Acidiplasma]|jgi:6-phosphofructokinase 1/ribokinase|uniref:Carbohydrate kinase PfkB domain-containing protein n=4 Tax=Acidiplasma TaxID=507753 RepID=A0A0Q0RWP5_9ARCH|nr:MULTISPECIES: nucleoside kinase [Acidiplasma]KJE49661.1 hypothetical protein TZ01_00645 [Acidiplasma sp. MBA-1]KQB36679.1 hypothetical protein AOG54_01925 [Acidiplasma aeolicum]KQB36783.1 hypothetical protein AOG55_03215 [Acidiplasma cupricumulans]WMT55778.1 MAG: nucleoside kinase [Acidiplasma sp.]
MKFLSFFGHLNIDVKLGVLNLPMPGEATSVKNLNNVYAGTAGNFAFVSKSLGVDYDLYAAVSRSTHSGFLDFLRQRNIDYKHIKIFDDDTGPICYIASDGKEQIAYMYQGPVYTKWKPSEYFEYDNYRYIHFGTGPAEEYIKIAEKNKNSKIVFDPGQETWYMYTKNTAMAMINLSNIMIINNNEFSYLLKMVQHTKDDLLNYLDYIIVTCGSHGSVIYSKDGEKHFDAYLTKDIHDTVGAGDSFRAGFYFGLYNNFNIEDSVKLGNIVASYAIRKPIIDFSVKKDDLMRILRIYNQTEVL